MLSLVTPCATAHHRRALPRWWRPERSAHAGESEPHARHTLRATPWTTCSPPAARKQRPPPHGVTANAQGAREAFWPPDPGALPSHCRHEHRRHSGVGHTRGRATRVHRAPLPPPRARSLRQRCVESDGQPAAHRRHGQGEAARADATGLLRPGAPAAGRPVAIDAAAESGATRGHPRRCRAAAIGAAAIGAAAIGAAIAAGSRPGGGGGGRGGGRATAFVRGFGTP